MMFVEALHDEVPWTKPADLEYGARKALPRLGGVYQEGYHAGFADGSWRFIPTRLRESIVRALITKAGGEPLAPQNYQYPEPAN